MRKVPVLVLLILFFILLVGCGADRAQTPPPAEKPAVQSEKAAVSPTPATERAPSAKPAPAESAKAAPPKPPAQPKDSAEGAVKTLPAYVTGVVDGDTVHVRLENGKEEKVRFIGVDTPESTREVEPYGKEAAAYTKKRLDGRTVYLELDVGERDKYGRLLAYVWLSPPKNDGEAEVQAKMFNAELLLNGYAQVMTVLPNVKYANLFAKFQREAREAEKGLWGAAAGAAAAGCAAGSSALSVKQSGAAPATGVKYIGNARSKKFHRPDCEWAQKIAPGNKVEFKTREEAVEAGYVPCKVCKP